MRSIVTAPSAREATTAFRLFSKELHEGSVLATAHAFNDFGHQRKNRSPQLAREGMPEGTKSLVLTMYDPDAPTRSCLLALGGRGHSFPSQARDKRGPTSVPPDTSAPRRPPGAMHRYVFTLHAVAVDTLPVQGGASGALVGWFTNPPKVERRVSQ